MTRVAEKFWRRLRRHLILFGAFTLGVQVMETEVTVRPPKRVKPGKEQHEAVQTFLRALQDGDRDTYEAWLRVIRNLPMPRLEEYDNIFAWEFDLMEWKMFRELS